MEITVVEGEPISIDMLSEDALDESNLRQQFEVFNQYDHFKIISISFCWYAFLLFNDFLYNRTTIMIFSK